MSATTMQDLRTMVPISKLVKQAALDMYANYEQVQAQYTAWAIRSFKDLTRQTLKSPKRSALLTINKNLNSALLPCDFKEIIGGYLIDSSCGEKIPLNINPKLTQPLLIDDVGCEAGACEAQCGCYPKQLCNDIQTTQVINKIRIGDTDYDQTVTSTLLPGGEYYIVTTTPVLNIVTSGIDYINTKEYVTSFDLAECGCIKPTAQNSARLECLCYEAWCCHCAPCCKDNRSAGGYRIFEENGTIVFDDCMKCDKALIEYRGFLPKSGNEYLVPEVADETIIEYTKYRSIANKKGVPQWERRDQLDNCIRVRNNMTKVMGQINLEDVIFSALKVPQFNYGNDCGCQINYCSGAPYSTISGGIHQVVTNVMAMTNTSDSDCCECKPALITIQGTELSDGGTTYLNPDLATVLGFRIFANPFNRFMNADEYNVLPQGGFKILIGDFSASDNWFDLFVKYC